MQTDHTAPGTAGGNLTLRMLSDLDALERTIETITHHCIACGLPGRTARFNLRVALAEALNELLEPIRDRRAQFEQNMDLVEEAIMSGVRRGREIAEETMTMVRDAMRISSYTSAWK